jgi:hypothetical protein
VVASDGIEPSTFRFSVRVSTSHGRDPTQSPHNMFSRRNLEPIAVNCIREMAVKQVHPVNQVQSSVHRANLQ